jgi:hypothetical protein
VNVGLLILGGQIVNGRLKIRMAGEIGLVDPVPGKVFNEHRGDSSLPGHSNAQRGNVAENQAAALDLFGKTVYQ